jgi:hypothetical protein
VRIFYAGNDQADRLTEDTSSAFIQWTRTINICQLFRSMEISPEHSINRWGVLHDLQTMECTDVMDSNTACCRIQYFSPRLAPKLSEATNAMGISLTHHRYLGPRLKTWNIIRLILPSIHIQERCPNSSSLIVQSLNLGLNKRYAIDLTVFLIQLFDLSREVDSIDTGHFLRTNNPLI